MDSGSYPALYTRVWDIEETAIYSYSRGSVAPLALIGLTDFSKPVELYSTANANLSILQ